MNKSQLLQKFKDMLPAALGEPYILNTTNKPYIYVAFYNACDHEMADGRILSGCEFRLWKQNLGVVNSKVLAGIIGFDKQTYQIVINALTDQLTKSADLAPYRKMLVEMMAQIEGSQQV
jgi:hypothetical protein